MSAIHFPQCQFILELPSDRLLILHHFVVKHLCSCLASTNLSPTDRPTDCYVWVRRVLRHCGWCRYGIVLKKLDLTSKETVDVFVESVTDEPLLWSAWLELSLLVTDREMVTNTFWCLQNFLLLSTLPTMTQSLCCVSLSTGVQWLHYVVYSLQQSSLKWPIICWVGR